MIDPLDDAVRKLAQEEADQHERRVTETEVIARRETELGDLVRSFVGRAPTTTPAELLHREPSHQVATQTLRVGARGLFGRHRKEQVSRKVTTWGTAVVAKGWALRTYRKPIEAERTSSLTLAVTTEATLLLAIVRADDTVIVSGNNPGINLRPDPVTFETLNRHFPKASPTIPEVVSATGAIWNRPLDPDFDFRLAHTEAITEAMAVELRRLGVT